ncbi:MAG TPA: LiaF domain-containing protein [Gemmatimonadaceae bacterium]
MPDFPSPHRPPAHDAPKAPVAHGSYGMDQGGVAVPAPRTKGVVAFLSAKERQGPWSVPPHLRVVAVLGTATVDLRSAVLESHATVIEIFALFGSVDVIVPPSSIIVDCDGEAFAGTFTTHTHRSARGAPPPPSDAPRLRVTGNAYGGAVTVIVRR